MEDIKRSDFIRDEEFKMFLKQNFSNKLQEKLRESPVGKRIAMLAALGLKISIEGMAEKYISEAGYTMDVVGNLYIQEDAMLQIFLTEENRISKELNIDISKITDMTQLKKVIEDPEYKKSVAKYGVESTIDMYSLSPEARKEFKETNFKETFGFLFKEVEYRETKRFHDSFNRFESTDSLKEKMKSNEKLNMTEKEIEDTINNVEKDTIETSINNKATSQTIRCLYRLREAVVYKEFNSEISTKTEIEATLKDLQQVLNDSQYKKDIIDENGTINVEKAVEFLNKWETKRNDVKLFDNLSAAQNAKISDLDISKLPRVLVLFAQASRSKNEPNKKIALSMIREIKEVFGINLLDENGKEISFEKISAKYKEICGEDADIEQVIKENEWNEFTANSKLERVDNAIDNDLGIFSGSRDQVNAAKEEYNKLLERIKEEKKAVVDAIVSSNNFSTDQIVVLLYKFRCKELSEDGTEHTKIDGRQLRSTKEHGTARVIHEYICENSEQFKDYLLDNGDISGKKINELILRYDFSETEIDQIENAYDIIGASLESIEERKNIDLMLRKDLDKKLDDLVGKTKEEISDEEKMYAFSMATILEKDGALTNHMRRHLIRIDPERFRRDFTDSKKADASFSIKDAFSSFGKNIVELPKKIINQNEEKDSEKEGEKTSTTDKIKGFFRKLFGKKETPRLSEGEPTQEEIHDKASNITNQQSDNSNRGVYDINEKFNIDHEAAKAAVAAKEQDGEKAVDEITQGE